MRQCPFTYNILKKNDTNYSNIGLKELNPRLNNLEIFPYDTAEQIIEAKKLASKLSIQGVQPKLSVKLNVSKESFQIVERHGEYIVKPQTRDYPQLPENEDITMDMAKLAGIETSWHGLILNRDKTFSYIIKRFDRLPRKKKIPLEDFAQLIGADRNTKYLASMERVADVIEEFCTYPTLELLKLFRRVVFCFLVGNEDMHLKNFSLITKNKKILLSPAYDLINTTIVMAEPEEELALELNGKKKNLLKEDFVKYFATTQLLLTEKKAKQEINNQLHLIPTWKKMIKNSFLSEDLKNNYIKLIEKRGERLK